MGAEQLLPQNSDSFRVVDDRKNREVYVFTVPLRAQQDVGITSLGLVKLTLDEEERIYESMRGATVGSALKVKTALARASLQSINGKPVPAIGEGRDVAIGSLAPKAREMLMGAYRRLHELDQETMQDFLNGVTAATQ